MNIVTEKKSKRFRGNHRYKSAGRLIKTLAITVIVLCLVSGADNFVRPTVNAVASISTKNKATALISHSVTDYIEKNNLTHKNLITITKNTNEQITSIEADMLKINKMRNGIIEAINASLESEENNSISIPLGTLLQSTFFGGRGFNVNFKICKSSAIKTAFANDFSAVGINQTRHRIILNVTLDVNAQIPFFTSTTPVTEDIIIAETIIVGEIPSYITKFT